MDCLGCPAPDEPPEARQQVLCDSPRARTVAPSDSVWETRQSDVAHQAVAPHNYPSSGVDRRVPRLSRKEIRWNDCRPRPSARHLCLPFCNASIFAKPGHGRRSRFLVPSLILLFVLLSQDQRQAVLAVSDHDDLRIHAFGQVLGSLYSLPLEQSRADALSHDLLEIANGCPEIGFNQYGQVIGPDFLIDLGRLLRIEVVNEGGVKIHDQTFGRGYAGRFLDLLRPNRELMIYLEGIHQVNAFGQNLSGDTPEQRKYADIARFNSRYRREQ